MEKSTRVLNELLVEIFNDILIIEQKALKEGEFNDLTITEIHTIEVIGLHKPRSTSEVANSLEITFGTLTAAINNLVKKEYVKRKRIEEDRRIVQIHLTKKGKLAYKVHNKFHIDMVKATVEGLQEKEEKVLVESLEKLNAFFKSKYNLKDGKKNE